MTDGKASAMEQETRRIRQAYARRPPDPRYALFNRGALFMLQEAERKILALLQQHHCQPLTTKKILEIGCGTGYWLREFIRWGALPEHIYGIDLLSEDVDLARTLCPATVQIACGNAVHLPYATATFDLVLQATVFTSILDPLMKQQLASEMLRVVKDDGMILWYDYHVNNPRNHDVRGVKKREIRQLFPACQVNLQRLTLAPPVTRALAPYSWLLCAVLAKIPWLCTHYLGLISKAPH